MKIKWSSLNWAYWVHFTPCWHFIFSPINAALRRVHKKKKSYVIMKCHLSKQTSTLSGQEWILVCYWCCVGHNSIPLNLLNLAYWNFSRHLWLQQQGQDTLSQGHHGSAPAHCTSQAAVGDRQCVCRTLWSTQLPHLWEQRWLWNQVMQRLSHCLLLLAEWHFLCLTLCWRFLFFFSCDCS